MKFLMILAFLLSPLCVFAEEESNSEFSNDLELRVRFLVISRPEMNRGSNSDNPGTSNSVFERSKLGLNWKKGTAISARIGLIHNYQWGQAESVNINPSADEDSSIGAHDGVNSDNVILVYEAYAKWLVNDNLLFKIGRQPINIGVGSVMGTNDFLSTPPSFDSFYSIYDTDSVLFSAFVVKAAEFKKDGNSYFIDDPESNFYGFTFDILSLPSFINLLNFHIIKVLYDEQGDNPAAIDATEVKSESTLRYGIALGGDFSQLDYKIQYAGHSGDSRLNGVETNASGEMYDIEAGFTFNNFYNLRTGLSWHMDSGDDANTLGDEQYNPFYYEQHTAAGLMDISGWGNLTSYGVHTSLNLKEDLKAGASYWKFERTDVGSSVGFQQNGGPLLDINSGGNPNANKNIGDEYDLYLEKYYQNGFSILAQFGLFSPGDYLSDAGFSSTATQYLLQGKMTF